MLIFQAKHRKSGTIRQKAYSSNRRSKARSHRRTQLSVRQSIVGRIVLIYHNIIFMYLFISYLVYLHKVVRVVSCLPKITHSSSFPLPGSPTVRVRGSPLCPPLHCCKTSFASGLRSRTYAAYRHVSSFCLSYADVRPGRLLTAHSVSHYYAAQFST